MLRFPEIIDEDKVKLGNRKWYLKTYLALIEKCKITEYPATEITEVHHIVPRCMNGGNNNENLVTVDTRSHILLHLLLSSAYPNNYKLLHAAQLMADVKNRRPGIRKVSTKLLSIFRNRWIEFLRKTGIKCKGGELLFKAKSVVCYGPDTLKVIRIFPTIASVKQEGFVPSSVSRCCSGYFANNIHGGYKWDYIEEFSKHNQNKVEEYLNLGEDNLPKLNDYSKLSTKERKQLGASGISIKIKGPDSKIYSSYREAGRVFRYSYSTIAKWAGKNKNGFSLA